MRYLAFLFLFWSSTSFAGTATVRSGEHDNFTRFVVALSEASDYAVAETASVIELTLDSLDSVELDRSFERVRKERVSNVFFREKTLVFEKVCDCETDVFPMGERLIVIDVYNRGDLEARSTVPVQSQAMANNTSQVGIELPSFWKNENPTSTTLTVGTPRASEGQSTPRAVNEVNLPNLQQRLAADVGVALTQGTLSHSALPEPEQRDESSNQDTSEVEDLLPESDGQSDALFSNLRTSGAIDVGAREMSSPQLAFHSNDCRFMDNYDIAGWDPKLPFNEAIAKNRRELVGEFDVLNVENAISLARTYAFFGFGAESLAVSNMADMDDKRLTAVHSVAEVLEYGSSVALNSYSFLECGGPLALWAALSFEEVPSDVIFDEDDVIRELNNLPKHLRRLLAPELSKRLRKRGSVAKAALIMRGAERSEGELSSKGLLENSEVRAIQNGIEQTESDVQKMVALDTQEAPLALISFINQQVKNGKDISSEVALLAESFALQFRGTDIERDLIAAHMISLAKSGQFEKAFELLYSQPNESRSILGQVDNLFETLNDAASEVVFLKYVVLPVEDPFVIVSERVRLKLVERALSIGFDALAERLLLSVVDSVNTPEYGLLKAKLLLRSGRADAALVLLRRLDLDQDEATKAQAYFSAGSFDEAAEIFDLVGREEERFEAVFRSEAASTDGLEGAEVISALRRIKEPVQDVAASSLASVEALLNASEQTRSDSDLLMQATRLE